MSLSIFGPAYRIVTPRLVIRCYNPSDAPLLKDAVDQSREHLRPWMPWADCEPEALEVVVERLRSFRGRFDLGQDYIYGIFNLEETRVLGGTGLHTRVGHNAREIGYWIHADFTHRGLASETAGALTRVAFEIDAVQRVEIHCDPANVNSAAVPRKLGYTHEATLRQRLEVRPGVMRDVMVWTLLKDDYPATPSAQAVLEAFDAQGKIIC
jgi:RimJ/RimL family protein N-acetyltransferase